MADFLDAEAEESSEGEQEVSHGGKKKRRKTKAMAESEEEEEEDDEARLREELKDLIDDNSIDESADESDDSGNTKKRKKSQSADFDDRLEDDDYDLIEENLGITVQRKKRFKRLRRIEELDSDEERELEPAEERDAIANQLFDGSGDEDERRSVVSHRPEPEIFTEAGSEADEISDADDFIVDDDGRPVTDKRRKRVPISGDDAALQEAQDIFGIDFDYAEFDKYGEEANEEEEEDEEEDEDEEEYVDDDVDGERARRPKKTKKKKGTRKSIFEVYEPSELKRGHFTDLDNEIRNTDVPERMQLRSIPVKSVAEGSEELTQEAKWIYKHAFCRPTISIQDAHLSDEAKERARKGPQTIGKIRKALDFMRNQNFEVPFISFYRKEYVNPELNINDLWKVYKWDAKWCELRERKQNLTVLFEKMRSYQLDEIMKNPDAPLSDSIRVIREEDIDRLKSVETSEELNDVHHHFMLYYSHEIPNMQAEVRLRNKESRLAERRATRLAEQQRKIAEAEDNTEEQPYLYGTDNIDIDDVTSDNETDDILKQASRIGPYAICRKAGLEGFAKKFGLTPEQYAENLRDCYQRHEIEQEPIEPCIVATDYRGQKFNKTEEIVKAAQLMVAIQLAREPLVRKCVREMYMERAKITTRPTKKGIKEIDENHPIYTMKYLKNKSVRELVGDEYLRLVIAERDKLITINLSDTVEGTTSDNYLTEMRQLYHRDEFSKNVQEWNNLRAECIDIAFQRMIIPDLKKELCTNLMAESKEYVLRCCSRKMYNWIKVAPYQCNFSDVRPSANEDEEEWDNGEETAGRPENRYDDDEEWKTSKGLRIMGLAYVPDYSQAAFTCIISPDGECTDYLRLPNILKRKNSFREEDKIMKEADLLAIRNFIATKKPHVIVIGGESRESTMLRDDIKECISELVLEAQFPMIEVEIIENELAKIYSNSNRGIEEFRDYPIILRQAISLARRLQDPLVEFSQLCGLDNEILCLNYHQYQDQLSKEEILENIQLEFVNRVNEVGVDLNRVIQHENTGNLVQFICGFGTRKGHALVKLLKQTSKRIENRTQLVTLCHMGPKVFINCAGFVKIDTTSLGDSTDTYVEILDSTRIHPETYEWARKMAVDALEYDDDEANPADALHEIFQTPDRLKDLDLDAFAEELERQGFGNKCLTLYDIRAELNSRYKDLRAPYEPPSPEKLFNILTKETPESFYIGKLILATVCSMNRRKPEGEQLDQANPVRNDVTGLWQCPFCLKNDFPELSEVWNHFDAGTCPGKAIGVRLRLDNGVSGYIHIRNLSDKHVGNPEERVHVGQVIHCRVIKIEVDRFSVECSSKGSDLADKNNEWRPQRDLCYDTEAEEKDLKVEEETKKNKQRQAYVKRVIVHTAFHNISYTEAAKLLEPMKQGEAIVRPSSKGSDHLTVTWKVTDDVLHHIDVREDGKKFAFSLGKHLFIGNEEFEDLDEILARHVNPMAAYASELLECHYYKTSVDGLEEKADEIMKEQKRENPSRIPCILSASKKYPGKFLLSYLPRERCMHEYISVSPDGVRYRGRTFARVQELFSWFRKHFRDQRPVVVPTTPFYTPGIIPDTSQQPNDDLDHHTLSMTSSDTPFQFSCVTPGTAPVSQYGSTYPSTPYTPSAKTPYMTPVNGTPYQTPKSQRYGQSTPGRSNDKSEFRYPGAPPSVGGWSQRASTPSRPHSSGDFNDWKRNRNDNGSTGYDNSSASPRARGRGRGRGGRGGRGGGRGRGTPNASFNSSRGGYSNSASSGGNTPLWDESESWDDPVEQQNSSYKAQTQRGAYRGGSSRVAPSSGNNTPLWDESESWDDPEPSTPAPTIIPPNKTNNSSYAGTTSFATTGNRSPLWDESESWDNPEPAITPNVQKPPTSRAAPSRQSFGNASRTNSRSTGVPSSGNRSPLWDESESWDQPEPSKDTRSNASMSREPSSQRTIGNVPPSNSGPPSVASFGNKSPLYDESESWDDPEPSVGQNKAPTSSYNAPSTNSRQQSTSTIGSRTPLYAPNESWDDEEPSTPQIPASQAQKTSFNVPRNANFPSNARPAASRTPLYAPSESWDDEEPSTPQIPASQAQKTSFNVPRNANFPSNARPAASRTPLYAPSESWDDEEPSTPQIPASQAQKTSFNVPRNANFPSNARPAASRTPLYAPSESWDDEEPSTPQIPASQLQKTSHNMPKNANFSSNARPAASRTPLYAPSESWDDEEPSTPQVPASQAQKTSFNVPKNANFSSNARPAASRTPLYAPSESWDDEEPSTPQIPASQAQKTSFNMPKNPNFSSNAPAASRTPLYAPSESWDDEEPSTPQIPASQAQKTPYNKPKNPNFSSNARPAASRTPLYAPSESWDDEEPSTPQVPASQVQKTSFNVPKNANFSSNARPAASRTPLYAPSESWDDEEPSTSQIPASQTQKTSKNMPKNANFSSNARPAASRTPLYAPSESWDDEEPSTPQIPASQAQKTSHNMPKNANFSSNARPAASRTPLYAPSESWDDEEPSTSQIPASQTQKTSKNMPKNANFSSNARPAASRTPLYAPSESWDEPEESTPKSSTLPCQKSSGNIAKSVNSNSTTARPMASRTPLYTPEESWDDDPEPITQQNKVLSAKTISSSARATAGRAPLYAPNESWNKTETATSNVTSAPPSPKSSYMGPQTNNINRSNIRPAGSRTPLYPTNVNWEEPTPAAVNRQQAAGPSNQPFGKIPRINSSQSGDRPMERRPHVYAPLWNEPEPIGTPRRGGGRTSRQNSSRRPSRNSDQPSIPKTNVDRSPLYDESESWD